LTERHCEVAKDAGQASKRFAYATDDIDEVLASLRGDPAEVCFQLENATSTRWLAGDACIAGRRVRVWAEWRQEKEPALMVFQRLHRENVFAGGGILQNPCGNRLQSRSEPD
jgi:hypothetical protein